MELKAKLKQITGILGKPDKPMGKANLDALEREIAFLESEFARFQDWATLATDDKSSTFVTILEKKVSEIVAQYHTVAKDDLDKLQIRHTLLKELLYAYLNATAMKDDIMVKLKAKRELYERTQRS